VKKSIQVLQKRNLVLLRKNKSLTKALRKLETKYLSARVDEIHYLKKKYDNLKTAQSWLFKWFDTRSKAENEWYQERQKKK